MTDAFMPILDDVDISDESEPDAGAIDGSEDEYRTEDDGNVSLDSMSE
jgi:hypothetical protein